MFRNSVNSPISAPIRSPFGLLATRQWTPAQLGLNVRERTLEGGLAYESSLLSNLPVLRSLEPYGTYRAPRQGRCYYSAGGMGTGVRGATPTNIGISGAAPRTVMFRAKIDNAAAQDTFLSFGAEGTALLFSVGFRTNNYFFGGWASDWSTGVATDTNWHHHAITYNGTQLEWFIDGVSIGTNVRALNTTNSPLTIMARQRNIVDEEFGGFIHDLRVYNVAKSLAEIQAIYAGDYEDPDRTGLVAGYWCNEESGTLGYDWSGNGRHLTLTNITQATFHAADTGVTWNANNVHGYRLSGSVYIPANLSSPGNAADGNALTHTGQAPYPVATESVCLTGDGSSVYADLGSALIPATADFELDVWLFPSGSGGNRSVISQQSGSYFLLYQSGVNLTLLTHTGSCSIVTPTATWCDISVTRAGSVFTLTCNGLTASFTAATTFPVTNTLLFQNVGTNYSDGRISDLRITTGGVTTYFPLQDGPGTSNLNRNLAWYKSDGTAGVVSNAIINGTVANIWANRCPRVKDWCIEHGGALNKNQIPNSNKFDSHFTNGSPTLVQGVASPLSYGGNAWTFTRTTTASSWVGYGVSDKTATPQIWTGSIYVKKNVGDYVAFRIQGAYPSRADIVFNLTTGAMHQAPTAYGSFTNVTGGCIEDVNGWYRIWLTATTDADTAMAAYWSFNSNGVEIDLVDSANNSSGHAFALQLEQGELAPYRHNVGTARGSGHFVLGLPDSNLCADGGPKTIPAGKHGNPYSRLIPNPFTAAELNGRNLPAALAPGGTLATITPANSGFLRNMDDGDDRLLVTKTALTGAALSKAQEYTAQ